MKRIWISLIAAGLLTIAAISPAAGQNIFSVALDSVDDSGIRGGASIRGADGQIEVTVFISEGETDGVHPVHIHEGTCADLGDVAYPLEDIEGGESVTTVDVSLADVMTGEYAINAHMSADDMGTHVMCGNVPAVEGLAPADDDEAAEADDAVEEDDADDATDDEDMTEEEDDTATDDSEASDEEDVDDTEDMVPAAGSSGGPGSETLVLLMTMMGSATLGAGLLVRRRFASVPVRTID